MNSGHKKRKYALAAALVGVLVLPLFGCQKSTGENISVEEVQQQALEYLASRYSAEFTITSTECKTNNIGPLPALHKAYHWELTVISDQFPDDTFTLRYGQYGKTEDKEWHWRDNYYTLLFRDEPAAIIRKFVEEFFGVDCIVEAPDFQDGWLDGIGENSTLQEWIQAGGRILDTTIWFCDFLPDEDACMAFSDALAERLPITNFINFRGLTSEGFQAVSEQQKELNMIWNEHREWIIGRIDYSLKNREIVLSQRCPTD